MTKFHHYFIFYDTVPYNYDNILIIYHQYRDLMKQLLFLLLVISFAYSAELSELLQNKPTMSEESLTKKQEGAHYTGLPLFNYDENLGFGYGARVFWFDYGKKEDTTFKYVPYKHRVYMQFFQTTNGFSKYALHYDAPYVADTLFKVTSNLIYEKNTQAHYFGTTSTSLNDLDTPDGKTFVNAHEQENYLKSIDSPFYNRYILEIPSFELELEYDLFGGIMRAAMGLNLSHANITNYQNAQLDDTKNIASKLYDDNEEEAIVGFAGGFDNGLKFSLVYDSRDYASNAKNGSAHDLTLEFYSKAIASDYEHQRYTFSTKNFLTLDQLNFVTFAGRWIYSIQSGDTPFYRKNMIGYEDAYQYGLGGYRTLRGYQQDRFVADIKTLANIETRFQVYQTTLMEQSFDVMLVPFIDAGSVFDSVQETNFENIKYTYGAGMRIAWNLSTVMMMDYGTSREGSALYIHFSHIF